MYVYTGELLGQPSPKSAGPGLPDWARIYLKEVREGSLKNLSPYVALFETITFHRVPLWSNPSLSKVGNMLEKENVAFASIFLSELGRIRDARLFQNKNLAQLHENHRKLFQDVVTSFKKFEPKDLEPILIERLLLPDSPPGTFLFRGMPLWNLGKRFVEEKLLKGLSTRVTKSAWYMQDALFTRLGLDLGEAASKHEGENANFKKKVEDARKARAKRP